MIFNGITIIDVKARKKHKCHICKGEIDTGEVYTNITKRLSPNEKRFRYPMKYKICLHHSIDYDPNGLWEFR